MPNLQAFIIEDNQHERERTKALMESNFPEIMVECLPSNLDQMLQAFEGAYLRILLVDVRIGNELFFKIYDHITFENTAIIFITNDTRYALEAFKVEAVDYILKPLTEADLITAVNKAIKKLLLQTPVKAIGIRSNNGLNMVEIQNLVWVQSHGNYTIFHLANGNSVMSSKTMKSFSEPLEISGFIKVHRSCYVNMSKVHKYDTIEYWLEACGGARIKVSRPRHKFILRHIKNTCINI